METAQVGVKIMGTTGHLPVAAGCGQTSSFTHLQLHNNRKLNDSLCHFEVRFLEAWFAYGKFLPFGCRVLRFEKGEVLKPQSRYKIFPFYFYPRKSPHAFVVTTLPPLWAPGNPLICFLPRQFRLFPERSKNEIMQWGSWSFWLLSHKGYIYQ